MHSAIGKFFFKVIEDGKLLAYIINHMMWTYRTREEMLPSLKLAKSFFEGYPLNIEFTSPEKELIFTVQKLRLMIKTNISNGLQIMLYSNYFDSS